MWSIFPRILHDGWVCSVKELKPKVLVEICRVGFSLICFSFPKNKKTSICLSQYCDSKVKYINEIRDKSDLIYSYTPISLRYLLSQLKNPCINLFQNHLKEMK